MTSAVRDTARAVRHPSSLTTLLLLATLTELILFGGGRLLQVGPLTVRMILYGAGISVALLHAVAYRRVNIEVAVLSLAFVSTTAVGALIGLSNGAPLAQVGEDVKPQLFFLSMLFLHMAITDRRQITRVSGVIRWSSVMLAAGFLTVLALLVLGVIPFGSLYAYVSRSDDFFFRGEISFFYKGFLYLGIGVFFFAFESGGSRKFIAALLATAVVATLTRGLILSLAVVSCVAIVLRSKNVVRSGVVVVMIAGCGAALWAGYSHFFGDRVESDALRSANVVSAVGGTTPFSIFLGHGLGMSIGGRDRIEESYISIFFQQGAVGLLFWFALFLVLVRYYRRAVHNGARDIADPYFLSALFVFIESATNPFLTNPIGMSMVLVAIVVCRVLASEDATAQATTT